MSTFTIDGPQCSYSSRLVETNLCSKQDDGSYLLNFRDIQGVSVSLEIEGTALHRLAEMLAQQTE
jgi:hypothetical protein